MPARRARPRFTRSCVEQVDLGRAAGALADDDVEAGAERRPGRASTTSTSARLAPVVGGPPPRRPIGRPMTTTSEERSPVGFSRTGFMATSGSAPAATACSHWARPISPPSAVTMAFSDMFWPLNGATATPRRARSRHSPTVTVDLPASEEVPQTMSAPFMARVLHRSRCEAAQREPLDRGPRQHTWCKPWRSPRTSRSFTTPTSTSPSTSSSTGSTSSPRASAGPRRGTSLRMWAGASVQIEYFIYGAILMTFGLTFAQVLFVIVLGNLSYFLLGLCSLQGPNAGTTVFAINRAPFGPNGSRPISFFNWITQIGFEVEGLILIVGAGLVLMIKAGLPARRPGQGRPRHRGRAHSGHPALPRPRRHRQDAAPARAPLRRPLRRPAGLRRPARQPARRQEQRRLAGLHGGARLHHRPQRAGLDRERQRLHPLLPDRHVEEGHRRLGLPRHGRARDPHHDAGRGRRHLRPQHRDGRRRVPPLRPPERHPARGSWWCSCSSPWCRSSASTASTCTRRASPSRPSASRSSATRPCSSTASSPSASPCGPSSAGSFTAVPVGLRRHRHRLDRAVERHLPRRLGPAALPLRAERAAEDRARLAVLAQGRHLSGRPSAPRWSACSPPSRRST